MMNEHANPIEFLIDFAWANGADRFVVNNAKDELKEFRKNSLANPVAWARINEHGDLFDIRTNKNPFIKNLVPLYVKQEDIQQIMSGYSSSNK